MEQAALFTIFEMGTAPRKLILLSLLLLSGVSPAAGQSCSNTCNYASDGDCDDGGPGAEFTYCSLGTDCRDCGPRSGGGGGNYPPPPSPLPAATCAVFDVSPTGLGTVSRTTGMYFYIYQSCFSAVTGATSGSGRYSVSHTRPGSGPGPIFTGDVRIWYTNENSAHNSNGAMGRRYYGSRNMQFQTGDLLRFMMSPPPPAPSLSPPPYVYPSRNPPPPPPRTHTPTAGTIEQNGCCSTVTIIGNSNARAYQSSRLTTYTMMTGITQGGRPVYQSARGAYLFYYEEGFSWLVGSDYTGNRNYMRSFLTTAGCPDAARGSWRYFNGVTSVSNGDITVTSPCVYMSPPPPSPSPPPYVYPSRNYTTERNYLAQTAGGGSMAIGIVIATIIGGVIGLGICVACVYCYIRRRRSKDKDTVTAFKGIVGISFASWREGEVDDEEEEAEQEEGEEGVMEAGLAIAGVSEAKAALLSEHAEAAMTEGLDGELDVEKSIADLAGSMGLEMASAQVQKALEKRGISEKRAEEMTERGKTAASAIVGALAPADLEDLQDVGEAFGEGLSELLDLPDLDELDPMEMLEKAGGLLGAMLGAVASKAEGLPRGWRKLKEEGKDGKTCYEYVPTGQATYDHPSELPKGWLLPSGWRQLKDVDGKPRYYNTSTDKTTRIRPKTAVKREPIKLPSAAAEATTEQKTYTVVLNKPKASSKLGISLKGKEKTGSPIVGHVTKSGIAYGEVFDGDELKSINGVAIDGHEQTVKLLKEANGEVTLVVNRVVDEDLRIKSEHPENLKLKYWKAKLSVFRRIASTFEVDLIECLETESLNEGLSNLFEEFISIFADAPVFVVTCSKDAAGKPTLNAYENNVPEDVNRDGMQYLCFLSRTADTCCHQIKGYSAKAGEKLGHKPHTEGDILSLPSYNVVQGVKPSFYEDEGSIGSIFTLYEGDAGMSFPIDKTFGACRTVEAFGKLKKLMLPEPLMAEHATEWTWFGREIDPYIPSNSDRNMRYTSHLLDLIRWPIGVLANSILYFLFCCCLCPANKHPPCLYERIALVMAARATCIADYLAADDNAFVSGLVKLLPDSNELPGASEAGAILEFVNKYADKVRRDLARKTFTTNKKPHRAVSHGIKKKLIYKLRNDVFTFGPQSAAELETMFWLVVKVRLLRHALALNIKKAKSKVFWNKATKMGGLMFKGAGKALSAASEFL